MSHHSPAPTPTASATGLFWILLLLFVVLAAEYGLRMWRLAEQRRQLMQARRAQAQNWEQFTRLEQIGGKLQPIAEELWLMARTNPAAQQIVREFNIQWNPPTTPAAARTAPASPAAGP